MSNTVSISNKMYNVIERGDKIFFIRNSMMYSIDEVNDTDSIMEQMSDYVMTKTRDTFGIETKLLTKGG